MQENKRYNFQIQCMSFLLRDAVHSTDYTVARCLSIRLSVTRHYCVEMAKHILRLFHHQAATPL